MSLRLELATLRDCGMLNERLGNDNSFQLPLLSSIYSLTHSTQRLSALDLTTLQVPCPNVGHSIPQCQWFD